MGELGGADGADPPESGKQEVLTHGAPSSLAAARAQTPHSGEDDQPKDLDVGGDRTPSYPRCLRLKVNDEGGSPDREPTEGAVPLSTPKTQRRPTAGLARRKKSPVGTPPSASSDDGEVGFLSSSLRST